MYKQYYDKIADLMLFAINFKAGEKLVLTVEQESRDIGKKVVKKAYQKGAAYVEMLYRDDFISAEAIKGSGKEFHFPEYIKDRFKEISKPGWKSIAILTEEEGDVFENLPQNRATEYFRQFAQVKMPRQKAVMNNDIPWTLTFLPSRMMASKAFPELPVEEAYLKYWEAVVSIMRLDKEDPVSFWDEKMKKDVKRSELMTSLDVDYLHFEGPGTDLKVGVNDKARWIGGYDETGSGEQFMANIPTDEIFTSPDRLRVNGTVKLTRPFVMHKNMGAIPDGVWFKFEKGQVVDYGAEQGKESLDAFFSLDEKTRFLGEVALVDPQSPFARPGIIFYNGLYDENAACHLALGKAYPFTLKERGNYSDEQLMEMGMNCSTEHEDMMVGGSDVNVTAYLKDGSSKEIIKDGKFLI